MEPLTLMNPWRCGRLPDRPSGLGGLTLTDRALALCGLPEGARVLDVGCGVGSDC